MELFPLTLLATLVSLWITSEAGPLMHQTKFDNDLQKYQHYYHWLNHYLLVNENDMTPVGDCDECSGDCADRCIPILMDDVGRLLIKYKTFNGIQPIDGNLTEEAVAFMSMPRCDQKDSKPGDVSTAHSRYKRFTRLAPTSWDLRRSPVITISFKNYFPRLSRAGQEQVALECGTLWAAPSQLVFQLRPLGQETNIAIEFQFIDGPFNSLGRGQSPNYNPYSFLVLDSGENWKLRKGDPGQGQGPSLKWAMCHEMGHNLNLGHSSDRNAIMFGTGINQDETRLTSDDRNGIVSLYGNANGRTVVGRNGQTPSPPTQPPFRPTGQQPFRPPGQQPFRPPSQQQFRPPSQQPFRPQGQQRFRQRTQFRTPSPPAPTRPPTTNRVVRFRPRNRRNQGNRRISRNRRNRGNRVNRRNLNRQQSQFQ